MVWKADDPQGNEAAKCLFDILPYVGESGFDLGCGPHKVLDHFVGIDNCIDTRLYGIAMKPDLAVPSCERLAPFADEATETVFSSHLLEHIENHRAALREWWRVLKIGGHLILYLPHRDFYPNIGQPGANSDHKHDFHPDDIVAAMREVAADWDLVENQERSGGNEYSFLQVYRKLTAGEGQRESFRAARPEKRAGIVRPGAYGDSLWGASIAAAYKRDGYHVTMYTGPAGSEVLAHDPNIDRIVHLRGTWFTDTDWVLYYLHESKKYDRWVNLIGSVETYALPHPHEMAYHWPYAVRRARMDGINYLEAMHEVAQADGPYEYRFHPTDEEVRWAREQRAKLFPGPLVVVSPTGSGLPKTWPHVQAFMDLMAARGVYVVVLGELRQQLEPDPRYGCVLGKDLPMRLAMTLTHQADVVVGTESAIINAAAFEAGVVKVALLSHSTPANLTKHWPSTIVLEPEVACYPCHRLHADFTFCARHEGTGFAACQSQATAEVVAEAIEPVLAMARARWKDAA